MHGETKLRTEGFRTRDAHIAENLAALGHHVVLRSRVEPFPRVSAARVRGREPVPRGIAFISPEVLAMPKLRQRQAWWRDSVSREPKIDLEPYDAVIGWNPFLTARCASSDPSIPLVFDLLDDWSIHTRFEAIREDVERCYEVAFSRADKVFANSEGTLELARRFGRLDATLVPNGCDPERFALGDSRTGTRAVIGYGGKLGSRVDRDLIRDAAEALPAVQFVLAGPVLEHGWDRPLRSIPNIELLGDVPYSHYPHVVAGWDVGWVPHRVGAGEVGGDAIKVYEYRAAGLPVLTTPIIGTNRVLEGVRVEGLATQVSALAEMLSEGVGGRPSRVDRTLPAEVTWRAKAGVFAEAIRPTNSPT